MMELPSRKWSICNGVQGKMMELLHLRCHDYAASLFLNLRSAPTVLQLQGYDYKPKLQREKTFISSNLLERDQVICFQVLTGRWIITTIKTVLEVNIITSQVMRKLLLALRKLRNRLRLKWLFVKAI
ncbi:hypothetical protein LWI29_030417 [Acer saccharum]|uniref:Uncharacterized protein n=1 Tax=Acer saccharum TaxID=4024 RepID=A0AA39T4P5_ACESA|nr:hypothetical protein LWI29_030417 [Acer saccharum]